MGLINKKIIAALLVVTALSGCSSNDEDESLRVADLPDIENKFSPKKLWHQGVNGSDDYFSRIKPVIANDKVFTASREGDALAFDLKTGKELWQVDLSDIKGERGFFDNKIPALLNGGPIVGDDKVFIGSENGDLFALEVNTGKLVWQAKVRGEIIAAPAFAENKVVVNTAAGIIKAFDATTGAELWQVDQDVPPLTLRGISEPTLASGGVIVGTPDGMLSVYLLDKGQTGWSTEIGEPSGSTELERVIDVDSKPLVVVDKVYSISSRGNLVAVDLRTGRIVWQRKYSSYGDIAIDGNTIYLTDVKGHVYAVDRLNGLEKWSETSLTNRNVTGPVVTGNYVVVGDFDGYLYWLDKEKGQLVSHYRVDSSGIYVSPTVHDDILYVQSRDGGLDVIQTPK